MRAPVGWATGVALALVTLAAVAAADPGARFEAFRTPPGPVNAQDPEFVREHFFSAAGSGRWQLWEAAVDQFREHPLTGGGAGSYDAWWAQHGTLAMFVRNAHSLYLETLGELGVAGLLLVLAILGLGVVTGVRRRVRHTGDDETVAAATALVVAFAVAASIDWMWELTVVSVAAVVCLALVTGPATGAVPRPPNASPGRAWGVLAFAAGALALTAIGGQGISLLSAVELEESEVAAARGDLVASLEHADAARQIQPWAASPYLQRALVAVEAGALEAARRAIGEAIERDARNWRLWWVRARIETESGAVREARRSLLRAIELNPRSPLFADVRP